MVSSPMLKLFEKKMVVETIWYQNAPGILTFLEYSGKEFEWPVSYLIAALNDV